MDIAKSYEPRLAEERHYDRWEKSGFFAPEINADENAETFSIVIPPPNVTGSLHMGHALQHTIMDVLTRRKRMLGFRTLWLPGTDHAGISVQRKVVEHLRNAEKKSAPEVGRDEFVRRAWEWKEKFGNTIFGQMRREGASVDWSRQRFTMDESLSRAVRFVFCSLYEEGSIYRGLRIVNWCPKDRTVLSDLEVKEESRKDGKLTYLRYPIKDSNQYVVVATTRPETMLGDTAVAVNPNDARYRDIIGKRVALPLTGREIPVIADEYVDADFGTGAVKITPAHDPNDYEVGERHNLPRLLVMNDDATMNASAGADFQGLDRFAARERVLEEFARLGLLEKQEDYEITLPICERCKTIVEPILSEQWFVRMDELRDLALELMRDEHLPHFSPEVPHEKVYTAWLENLKDWTISRQLWWGHQIPAWYDSAGKVFVAMTAEEAYAKAGTRELKQDEDVLDTWFSSGLWAFSTFGWDGKTTATPDLRKFLPTDVLVTGRDIIFLWVSRMVMLTKKFVGKPPFCDVVVTGTVLGKDGKPMSKTRGNGVDPLEMFDKFGVDATRIYLASIATGADIKWNDLSIETYRNFANKIWNATRFCLLNAADAQVDPASIDTSDATTAPDLSVVDRWIISRFNRTALAINHALENYQFHDAVQRLYHFFWDDFCDWYVELVKDTIVGEGGGSSPEASAARARILTILEHSLRLLHPFMPFLTEDLWQRLPGTSSSFHNRAYTAAEASIMLADFPKGSAAMIDERSETEISLVTELITKIRNIRSELNIKPSERVNIHVAGAPEIREIVASNEARIMKLARADKIVLGDELNVPKASAKAVLAGGAQLAVPLEGLIDFAKERARLENQVAKLTAESGRLDAQLGNSSFVERAPTEKVDELRVRRAELEIQISTLRGNIDALGEKA